MIDTIPIERWLNVVADEYLSSFIREGGAAIKFAVMDPERKPALTDALTRSCSEFDFVFAEIDAGSSRVHMPQDIFFELAVRMDWRLLARRLILRLLGEKNLRVDGIAPDGPGHMIDAVARANDDMDRKSVVTVLHPILAEQVFKNPNMVKSFRVAMYHLCLAECELGVQDQYAGQPLLDWLTGVNRRIGSVRHFQIHTSINRTTARHFIESAFYWVRHAGFSGTIVLLDNRRVLLARNPKDGIIYYTRAAVMDHYELLRELIDDVDRLPGTFFAIVTGREFVEPQYPRGWNIYDALRTRVMDDVRDRNHVNPTAALVRLS